MRRVITGIVGLALTAFAFGQSWTGSYDAGLKAAKAGKWEEARKDFMQTKAYRPDDVATATILPGPVTEQRKWRNGSPYSPNFLAAYCLYREGMESKPDKATSLFKSAADEFEALITKKQVSQETVYFLYSIYGRLNQSDKKEALASKIAQPNWKVDTEILAPEEISAMGAGGATTSDNGGIVSVVDAGKVDGNGNAAITPGGPVPIISTKYALIICNGDNKLPGQQLPYAADDAALLKDSLSTNAGYPADNIVTLTNVNAAAMLAAAKDLASKMPAEGTLFFYFTGVGANVDDRDWFAGVNTEIATDTSSMVRKNDVFFPFTQKGISVYAFYQVPRPSVNGAFFGEEESRAGSISQMQSTMEGGSVFSIFRNGKNVGAFTDAITQVFSDLHTNSIPIGDFGWAVFYKIRQGAIGESGGGSKQTPTLPILQFLSSTSRF